MMILKVLVKIKNAVNDFLTHPATAIIATLGAMGIWLSFLTIGYFVAQLDPDGYNIIDNYISDMGSLNHTPNPFFLDYGAMITSFLLIPALFYLERRLLAPLPRERNVIRESSKLRLRLGSYTSFFMIIGLIGLYGIGFFSEDRSNILEPYGISIGLHGPFSYVVFGGLVVAGIFGGLLMFIYSFAIFKNTLFKILGTLMGLYMIIVPPIPAYLFITGAAPSMPYWEWMLLFAIMGWLIPAGALVTTDATKILKSR